MGLSCWVPAGSKGTELSTAFLSERRRRTCVLACVSGGEKQQTTYSTIRMFAAERGALLCPFAGIAERLVTASTQES